MKNLTKTSRPANRDEDSEQDSETAAVEERGRTDPTGSDEDKPTLSPHDGDRARRTSSCGDAAMAEGVPRRNPGNLRMSGCAPRPTLQTASEDTDRTEGDTTESVPVTDVRERDGASPSAPHNGTQADDAADAAYMRRCDKYDGILPPGPYEVNERYSQIRVCDDDFVSYRSGESETEYNAELSEYLEGSCLIHPSFVYLDGDAKVEPCDILWKNRFIFIKRDKPGDGPGSLCYAFFQAYNASAALTDPRYVESLNDAMERKGMTDMSLPVELDPADYRVIVCVISDRKNENGGLPNLTYQEKSAACLCSWLIGRLGYSFELKNIPTR